MTKLDPIKAGHRLLAVSLCLTLALMACRAKETPAPAGIPVQTMTAKATDEPQMLWSVGTVLASVSVNIKSRQDGHIVKIHFTDGDMVQAGQLLYTIDPVTQTLSKAQAVAGLASQKASADMAVADLTRYKALYAQNLVSKETFDQYRTTAETALAQVKTAQASVGIASQSLSYNSIVAPNSGRISLTRMQEGNLVVANHDVLAVINTITPADLSISLPERFMLPVRKAFQAGEVLVLAFDKGPEFQPIEGALRAIDNGINPGTGMFELRARFENKDQALWPGQFVGAGLVLDVRAKVVRIPSKALLSGPDGDYVYVVRQGKAAVAKVTVDFTAGEDVVLKNGLVPDDEVVLEGQMQLRPGMPVAVKNAQAPAPGAKAS